MSGPEPSVHPFRIGKERFMAALLHKLTLIENDNGVANQAAA